MKRRILSVICIMAVCFLAMLGAGAKALDYPEISLGTETQVTIENGGEVCYFSFTPQETGWYKFSSSAYADTYGYLYEEEEGQQPGVLLTYDDQGGDYGDFRIQYELTAGHHYIWGAKYFSEEQTGSFPVLLERYTGLLRATVHDKEDNYAEVYVSPGADAVLQVDTVVEGTCDLTYQWYRNPYTDNELIEGATENPYTVTGVTLPMPYECIVTDSSGNACAVIFDVKIDNNLSVNAVGGTDRRIAPGETVTLGVEATCTAGELSYRWEVFTYDAENNIWSWQDVDGAATDTLATGAINRKTAYCCYVSDAYGNTGSVKYDIYIENQLTAAPEGSERTYVAEGESAVLKVVASRLNGELTYSWSGYNYVNDEQIVITNDATSDELVTEPVYGQCAYECTVTDIYENFVTVTVFVDVDKTADYVCTALTIDTPAAATIADPGQTYWFSFTPEETAYYNVRSYMSEGEDPENRTIYICDQGLNEVRYESGWVADATAVKMYAGQKYLISAQFVDYDRTGTIWVRVERFAGIVSAEPIQGSVYADYGGSATLQVKVEESQAELTYTWKTMPSGDVIQSAAGDQLTIPKVTQYGEYRCTAADQFGNRKDADFRVYVNNPGLEISRVGEYYCYVPVGGTTQLQVSATGDGSGQVRYEWYKGSVSDDNLVSGATEAAYTVLLESPSGTTWHCVATDEYGNRTEIEFYVTPANGFSAYTNTAECWVEEGDSASLSVVAYCDDGSITCQWYRGEVSDDTLMAGETGDTLVFGSVSRNERGAYYCRVTDSQGNRMDVSCVLIVNADNHLQGFVYGTEEGCVTYRVSPGADQLLRVSVTADDTTGLTYRWNRQQFNAQKGDWDEWELIDGAESDTYTARDISIAANYYCEIGDQYGNTCRADFEIKVENHLTARASGATELKVSLGSTQTLAVTASCDQGNLNYQWYIAGDETGAIDGANGNTYTTGGINKKTEYYCHVSDAYGNSDNVYFSVGIENQLTAAAYGSENVYAAEGEQATLKVVASCAEGGVTYRWSGYDELYGEWIDIPDSAASDELETEPVHGRCSYDCTVTDIYGNSVTVTFHVDLDQTGDYECIPLEIGTPAEAVIAATGQTCWLSFTPEETAYYNVRAYTNEPDDTTYKSIQIYDQGLNKIDDANGCEARIKAVELYAGQKYLISVGFNDYEQTGTLMVSVERFVGLAGAYPLQGDVTAGYGGSATLQVVVKEYNADLTYTWKTLPSGDVIESAAGDQLTIPEVTQYGEYRCIVADQFGIQTNVDFRVYVDNPGLTISQVGEQYRYVTVGSECLLQVSASGAGSSEVQYQWYRYNVSDETLLQGAADAEYTVHLDDPFGSDWYCVATDAYGNRTIIYYYVTPTNGFNAYAGYTDPTVNAGDSVSLSLDASCSDNSISYQWYKGEAPSGILLDGKTENTLAFDSVSPGDRGAYYCHVSDSQGNQVDLRFFLTVQAENHLQAFVYGTEETYTSYTVTPGAEQELRVYVTADDTDGLTYMWQRQQINVQEGAWGSWEPIDGAEGDTYTARDINTAADYCCDVYDQYGNSRTVQFGIRIENHLAVHAVGATELKVERGGTATLAVTATCDEGELSYRWFACDDEGDTRIEGANGSTYTTGGINAYTTYRCYASDAYGNSESVAFSISVDNQLTAVAEGGETVYAAEGQPATLKVIASCADGGVTYHWSGYDYENDEQILIPDGTATNELVTDAVYGRCEYECTVTDTYFNTVRITFYVDVDHTLDYESEDLAIGTPAEAVIAEPMQVRWFSFTPEETAHYNVRAYLDEHNDEEPKTIVIYDQGMNSIRSVCSWNAEITAAKLYAGYKYLISVEFDNSQKTGTIQVCLERFTGLAEAYPVVESVLAEYGCGAALQVATEAYETELTYTWRAMPSGEVIGSATGDRLAIPEVTQYGEYRCSVADRFGNQRHVDFWLYVNNPGLVISRVGDYNRYVAVGEECLLEVSASGEGSDLVRYEWYRDSVNEDNRIPGATGSAYTALLDVPYGIDWYCIATDAYGNRTMFDFCVEPTNGFRAYISPQYTAEEGEDISFYVNAYCNNDSISCQWYRGEAPNGTLLTGETGSTLELNDVSRDDRGAYYCRVSDNQGNQADVSVFLTIEADNNLQAYVYDTETEYGNYTVSPGADQLLRVIVEADDMEGLTYEWQRRLFDTATGEWADWEGVEGAEEDSYNAANISTSASYCCTVRDQYANSATVYFNIYIDTGFSVEADGLTYFAVAPNEQVTMKVRVTCNDLSSLTYRWYGIDEEGYPELIQGAGSGTLTVTANRAETYYCRVEDHYGNSGECYFSIRIDNMLSVELNGSEERTVTPGQRVTVSVTASCKTGSLSYQWYVMEPEGNYSEIPGANEAAYTAGPIESYTRFYCKVSDEFGNAHITDDVVLFVENSFTATAVGSTDRRVPQGTEVSLEVRASCDEGRIRYQWYSFDTRDVLEGETSSTYVAGPVSKATEYYCRVSDMYGNNTTIWFKVGVRENLSDAPLLQANVPATVQTTGREYAYFRFIPDHDGSYTFYSQPIEGSEETDPYGERVDANGRMLLSDDDTGGSSDFSITCNLTAGKTYYFGARHNGEGDDIPYEVVITYPQGLVLAVAENSTFGLDPNGSATLKVIPTYIGENPELTYEWAKYQGAGVEVIPGANGDTLSVENVVRYDHYRCKVSDQYGNTREADFWVFVDNGLEAYAEEGEELTVLRGRSATLKVFATDNDGGANLTYEWYDYQKDAYYTGTDTFVTDPLTTWGGDYYCKVKDLYDNTRYVYFYVRAVDLFAEFDCGYGMEVGYNDQATLTVNAESLTDDRLTYRWYVQPVDGDTVLIDGAGGATYITEPVTVPCTYSCEVTDQHDNTVAVSCQVMISNEFRAEPVGAEERMVDCGTPVRLEVDASCENGTLTYSWQHTTYTSGFGPGSYQTETVEGADKNFLEVPRVTAYYEYYVCEVRDQYNNIIDVYFTLWLNEGSHEYETVPAVEPTCTEPGRGEEERCKTCGKILTAGEEIPADGHNWTRVTYTPSDDYRTVTASRHCTACGEEETETISLSGEKTQEAGCEQPELTTYTSGEFRNAAFVERTYTDVETAAATGHDWKSPTYVWADDNSEVTATRVCRNDPAHNVTETVSAASEKTRDETCEEAGEITWTSEDFQNPVFTAQTKKIAVDPIGHDWGDPDYEWADDNSSVTATRVCANDPAHFETETVETDIVRTEPTCETAGSVTYTATFTEDCFAEQTKTETLEATGHDWKSPTYVWADDNSEVTATRVCRNDPTHVVSVTVGTTSTVTREATCELAAEITYRAVFTNELFSTQIRMAPGDPALGHDWNTPVIAWSDDFNTATATWTCKRDPGHTETETVETEIIGRTEPACVADGSVTYKATFTRLTGAEDTKIKTLDATGHDWRLPTYTWSDDYSEVTAARVCYNDPTHVVRETVQTTGEETRPATCDTAGEITYTATFSDELFSEQVKKVPGATATGHDWDNPEYTWDADYSTVTATHTCKTNPAHTESETVGVTARYAEGSTCEEPGTITYTSAAFETEGFEAQTKEVADRPAGHVWGAPTYTWSADCSTVTAARSCQRCGAADDSETVSATSVITKEATCEEAGEETWTSAAFTNPAYSVQTKKTAVNPTGHTWSAPTYEWSANNRSATATRTCANDPAHTETETVDAEITRTEPTCETAGSILYTATFTADCFAVQVKEVPLPATGHDWKTPTYTWSADNSQVEATRACRICDRMDDPETVSATYEDTIPATCEEAGERTWTSAAFSNPAYSVQTKKKTIEPSGHAWGEPTYEWAADNSSVTATRVCAHDGAHTETETVETDFVRTEPTCDTDGSIVYTAKFTGACFKEQTKTVTLDATGHDWKSPTYTWSDGNTKVTATRVCRKDPTHSQSETVSAASEITTAATCEEAGEETWMSAAFENPAFAVQTKTVTIEPTGHTWGNPTYVWSDDNSSVTATRTCSKDPTHIETETVDTDIAGRTDPTCEAAGTISYTATFTRACFTKQPKTVEGKPALGHDWKVSYTWSDDMSMVTATRECNRCGAVNAKETVNVTREVTREATCTQKGIVTYTSDAFNNTAFSVQTYKEYPPITAHQLAARPGSDQLCEQGGTKPYWECEVCHKLFGDEDGETEIDEPEVIPAAGHKLTKHAAAAATCTKAGNSAYWTCDTCGKHFSDAAGTTEIAENAWVVPALGHDLEHHAAKAATCTVEGWKAYDTCKRDGCTYTTYTKIAALGHSWGSPAYAWASDNSTVTAKQVCSRDGSHVLTETVKTAYKVTKKPTYTAVGTGLYTSAAFTKSTAFKVQTKKVTIDMLPRMPITKAKVTAIDDQVYTGSAIKPALTIKYNKKKLVKGTDYTVSFKDNVKPGTATVTITGKNAYKGKTTVTFTILPKKVKLVSVKPGKAMLTVTWKKGAAITGYEIEYSLKKDFSKPKTVKVTTAATVKTKIQKLKAGKTYYVRIRAYRKVGTKMYYSDWSDSMKATVKGK